MTTIPDLLPVETPYLDALRRRILADGVDVPIALDKRTTFAPRAITAHVLTGTQYTGPEGTYDEKRTVVTKIELSIYGEMTFDDNRDVAAQVSVIHWPGTDRLDGAWCKSTRWMGRKFGDMPAGARKKVAAKIQYLLGPVTWQRLSDETQLASNAREININIAEATRMADRANEAKRRAFEIIPLQNKKVVD